MSHAAPGRKPYRFGFVLNTTLGNLTRYENLRKYAERDPEVEFTWAPASHHTPPELRTWLRFLPAPLFMRARMLQQAWPVLAELDKLDAVMVHLFEADVLCALRSYWRRKPALISSTDEAPITDRANYPLYPGELNKPRWRQNMRLALDRWRVRRSHAFVPFSNFVAGILVRDCAVPPAQVHPIHVGMDLELWRGEPRPAWNDTAADRRFRILFVGGDFVRKGGAMLLEVFKHRFRHNAELHLVTKQAPRELPPHVVVHDDFSPNDARLTTLYAESDVLVVPTTADLGPLWVFLEAMAMRLPVIGTRVGASTEVIRHGETGFAIDAHDATSLGEAIQALMDDAPLRRQMGENGRRLIERDFNASVNVPRILGIMKSAVNAGAAR